MEPGLNPPSPKPGKVSICFVLVILCFLCFWIIDNAGCDSNPAPGSNQSVLQLITKAGWKEKIRPYWNPGGTIKVTTIANFKLLFGEPSRVQTIEGHAFWYYDCSDGTIEMELVDPDMSRGTMLIQAVNEF